MLLKAKKTSALSLPFPFKGSNSFNHNALLALWNAPLVMFSLGESGFFLKNLDLIQTLYISAMIEVNPFIKKPWEC